MASRTARKLLLFLHVSTSVGLVGAVLAFLLLSIAGMAGEPRVYVATDIIASTAILPLAVAALVLGVIQSLASPWGLIQHYWVVFKLAATILVLAVLLLQMPGIHALSSSSLAALQSPGLSSGRMSLVLHSSAGMVPLLFAVLLSVMKPKGLTKYGWNKRTSDR